MKKPIEPTGDIRLKGQAEINGIAFEATKVAGPMGVTLNGTLATTDENGNILCTQWSSGETPSAVQAKINKFAEIVIAVAGILAILFLTSYFAISPRTGTSYNILFIISYIMMSMVWIPKAVGIFIARIFGNKEIKSFSKFLAAQNAVQNAFYDLGRVPSIEEARTYSTFSSYSNYISKSDAASTSIWLALAFVRVLPVPWALLTLIAIVAAFFIFARKLPFFFWQYLIVSKPENIHYQTALTALKESLVFIDSIHISTVSVTIEELCKDLGEPEFDEEKCKGCTDYNYCKERSQIKN